jgi:hypothetical protein
MLAGRSSVYDNEYYLSTTYPPDLDSNVALVTPTQRASMSIMHVFAQCPRLNCLVRNAILNPKDTGSLAAAVTLTEYLWQINLPIHVAELIRTAVTVISEPASSKIADILTETLHFDSIQSMILCTRYWMLQNVLCGLTDTLHRHFPTETALSLLPDMESVRNIDTNAGLRLAESLSWAESVSQKLPLVPLRLHTPLQISIGPWHRVIRHMTSSLALDSALDAGVDQQSSDTFSRAVRMKTWLIDECNRIHEQWDVSTVDESSLYEALDSMAGEEIPDWLPTRVRFEAEDGDMVIKLDYEKPAGKQKAQFTLGDNGAISQLANLGLRSPSNLDANALDPRDATTTVIHSHSPTNVADIGLSASASTLPGSADFLLKSGRNLCSTSGWWPTTLNMATNTEEDMGYGPCMASSWWPQTPKTSAVLLDSTHKTSAFQPKQKQTKSRTAVTFDNRNLNGCMSPAWTSTSGFVKSSATSDNGSFASTTSPKLSDRDINSNK